MTMVDITSSSTYAEVVAANEVTFTPADLAAWNAVTLPTVTETTNYSNIVKFGLFGFDMTDFWEDC